MKKRKWMVYLIGLPMLVLLLILQGMIYVTAVCSERFFRWIAGVVFFLGLAGICLGTPLAFSFVMFGMAGALIGAVPFAAWLIDKSTVIRGKIRACMGL